MLCAGHSHPEVAPQTVGVYSTQAIGPESRSAGDLSFLSPLPMSTRQETRSAGISKIALGAGSWALRSGSKHACQG